MTTTPIIGRRGFLAGTLAAGLGTWGLTACSTPAPPTTPGGTSGPVQELNFYNNVLGEDGQKEAWQAAIDTYAAAGGAKVEPVIYPSDQAATQLALMARSGGLSGVIQCGPWPVLRPFDVLADLSDLTDGLDIPPGILDSYTVDGQLLVLPQTAGGIGMVVNGTMGASAGLNDGLSVEDFAAALEKIKGQDPSVVPYAATTKTDLKDIVPWMWGFGSEVVTDDLRVTFGDAESVAAVTWFKGLLDAGLVRANIARADARVLFARGQTACYDDAPLASTFVVTNGAADDVVENLTAISRPQASGQPSFSRSWGGGLAVTKGAAEVTGRAFVQHVITDVATVSAIYEQSAIAPASKALADQIPALADNAFQTAFRSGVTEHARATAYDKLPVAAQIDTSIARTVGSILAGETDAQSGLNALKTEIQSLIDKNS